MLKIYIGPTTEGANLPVLLPNLGYHLKDKWLFVKKAFTHYTEPVFELTTEVTQADFLLVPENYFNIKDKSTYLNYFTQLAEKYHKPIILFAYGDRSEEITLPHSLIFRTSQYGYRKKSNEIIMPGYTEDLTDIASLSLRSKQARPVVSFCGWADFKDPLAQTKYYIKILLGPRGPERKGLYFRRKALSILSQSNKVDTNFIIRKSYSGHTATIEISPEQARQEYLETIINSDFVLAVKGDGNFSYRFYEALSLGRIPLFVDTDCELPLADLINYRDFVTFVDYQEIDRIDQVASDYYANLTEAEYTKKQQLARQAFEQYLRIDSYFRVMFKEGRINNYLKNINHGLTGV